MHYADWERDCLSDPRGVQLDFEGVHLILMGKGGGERERKVAKERRKWEEREGGRKEKEGERGK